jgi:eukaryotic-like serine/threonine-protein kinase
VGGRGLAAQWSRSEGSGNFSTPTRCMQMPEPQRCPNCSREMPACAPQGLCPDCLLSGVLDSQLPPAESKMTTFNSDDPPPRAADIATDADGTTTHVLSEHSVTSTDSVPTADLAPSDEPPDDDRSLDPGTQIRHFGAYEIRGELGRVAMDVVYKARQISLNRLVALKTISAGVVAGEEELRRFQNEAQAVARLDHPHIVSIYKVGKHDDKRYFSMKLIGGPCLSKTLAPFSANLVSAVEFMVTIAEAVHHAHQRGILHRDLKPSNILLDKQGEPHVSDFGLAK